MRILPKLMVVVLLPALLVLSGCETTGEAEQDQGAVAGGAEQQPAEATPAAAPETTAQPMEEPAKDPLEEGLLASRVVYFEFDSSAIADSYMPLLKAHGEYLSANGGTSITVEGHADERGTREYNIALGERRADAVRRVLLANGASPGQIKVVSYGEERPAVLGHDESAWSKNRRAELMY